MPMPLAEFKKLLGDLAEKLTDEQIECLYAVEYKIADAFFEWWLRQRKMKKQIDARPEGENNTPNLHETRQSEN